MLLHGRGADEHDLYPLLDALDPERRLLGITPRGPLALPPGGAHWYRLGGIPTPDPETFFPTFEAAAAFLDALPVPIERVVLGGFSQGAAMSWALGLGAGRPRPAAIIALSGFMPEVRGLRARPRRPRGLPDRGRARLARPGDPGRVRPGGGRAGAGRRRRRPLARDARAAHDRPARAARAAGVRRGRGAHGREALISSGIGLSKAGRRRSDASANVFRQTRRRFVGRVVVCGERVRRTFQRVSPSGRHPMTWPIETVARPQPLPRVWP